MAQKPSHEVQLLSIRTFASQRTRHNFSNAKHNIYNVYPKTASFLDARILVYIALVAIRNKKLNFPHCLGSITKIIFF